LFSSFPSNFHDFKDWSWSRVEPYYQDRENRPLNAGNVSSWLADWSQVRAMIEETYWRFYVATTMDTADPQAARRYAGFVDGIYQSTRSADQVLKENLLASGLQPEGFEIPIRNLRAEAALFRPANLPLLSEELKLSRKYDEIIGAQTVSWEGRELTVSQLQPVYLDPDRERREQAWRLAARRQLADRAAIGDLWGRFMDVRGQLAANAGLPDYRSYRWAQKLRFAYTPQDCVTFHAAIEAVAVPAASRLYEKRRRRLGVSSLRPWDLDVDPLGHPPLHPFQTIAELEEKCEAMFRRVDPKLGEYFATMRREGLLDLDNRKDKAPGGYCTQFYAAQRPFIFANSVGVHDDVQTLLHEGGHAFHVFEAAHLPYYHQQEVPFEFGEVASMGMEFLAGPYLPASEGGFYTTQEAARARTEHLERAILFWPYMAVVDAFQHWVYEHHSTASDPDACDAEWDRLWERFMPGVDWSSLEAERMTGWQRKLHIHQ